MAVGTLLGPVHKMGTSTATKLARTTATAVPITSAAPVHKLGTSTATKLARAAAAEPPRTRSLSVSSGTAAPRPASAIVGGSLGADKLPLPGTATATTMDPNVVTGQGSGGAAAGGGGSSFAVPPAPEPGAPGPTPTGASATPYGGTVSVTAPDWTFAVAAAVGVGAVGLLLWKAGLFKKGGR